MPAAEEGRGDIAPSDDRTPSAGAPRVGAPPPGAWEEEAAFCSLLTDAYLRTDAQGVIRKANGPASAMLQRPLWSLEGTSLVELVAPERRRALRTLLHELSSADAPRRWMLSLHPTEGGAVAVSATVAPIRDRAGALSGLRWLLRRLAPDDVGGADDATAAADGSASGSGCADLLARASALMTASLDHDATLRGVAQLAVPVLADWCVVDVLEPGGSLRRLAAAHGDGEPAAAGAALGTAAPPLQAIVEATGLLPDGVGSGAAVVQPVPAAALPLLAADAAQLAQLARLSPSAWLSVPLVARGQLLGVLSLVMAASGRRFSPRLCGAAEEFAHRAALAADNARLFHLSVQAAEAKSQFLATVSHELRTPLTAIVGYTELLRDGVAGEVAPAQQRMLDRVRESSDHLLALVDEVLRYARLAAREEQAQLDRVSLRALLEHAAALVEPLARRRGLAFEVRAPTEPVWLVTDVAKVRQILVNLLGNAVKFTTVGGVRLTGAVRSGRPGEPRALHLEVLDSGIGISGDELARVFDPFWQVERSATRSYGGAGLGLSVVQQLAHLLGGEVTVESEPGRGSRFTVRLPLEDGDFSPTRPERATGPLGDAAAVLPRALVTDPPRG